jgi:hypothetical protein
MLILISRLLVAAYFVFSAANKLFFLDLFAATIHRVLGLADPLALAFAVTICLLELGFAASLTFSRNRNLVLAFALLLCIPFIIYNLYLLFVLGTASCGCMYSYAGASATSSYVSLVVLLCALCVAGAAFLRNSLGMAGRRWAAVSAALLVLAVSVATGAWFRYTYEQEDLYRLRGIESLENVGGISGTAGVEVFLQLRDTVPLDFVAACEEYFGAAELSRSYTIFSPHQFPLDELFGDLSGSASVALANPDGLEARGLGYLGIQIYADGKRVFRADNIDDLPAILFRDILLEVSTKAGMPEPIDPQDIAGCLFSFAAAHDPAASEGEVRAYLLFDRVCHECDSEVISMAAGAIWSHPDVGFSVMYPQAPTHAGEDSVNLEEMGIETIAIPLSRFLAHGCGPVLFNRVLLIGSSAADARLHLVTGFPGMQEFVEQYFADRSGADPAS